MTRRCVASPSLYLSRPDKLAVRDLPALVPAKIESGTAPSGTRSAAASTACRRRWSRARRAYWKRCRDFHEAGRPAAEFQTRIDIGLPLRLRPLPRPRAALLSGADRDQRDLQPDLPGLLRNSSPAPHRQSAARDDRAHARYAGRQRRRARSAADLRRRADPASGALRRHRRGASARPIRHVMLNTNGIRIATEPDFVARLAEFMPRLRGLSAIRRAEAGRAADDPRRRSAAQCAARRSRNLEQAGISTTLVVTVKQGRQ